MPPHHLLLWLIRLPLAQNPPLTIRSREAPPRSPCLPQEKGLRPPMKKKQRRLPPMYQMNVEMTLRLLSAYLHGGTPLEYLKNPIISSLTALRKDGIAVPNARAKPQLTTSDKVVSRSENTCFFTLLIAICTISITCSVGTPSICSKWYSALATAPSPSVLDWRYNCSIASAPKDRKSSKLSCTCPPWGSP